MVNPELHFSHSDKAVALRRTPCGLCLLSFSMMGLCHLEPSCCLMRVTVGIIAGLGWQQESTTLLVSAGRPSKSSRHPLSSRQGGQS